MTVLNCAVERLLSKKKRPAAGELARTGEPKPGEYFDLVMVWSGMIPDQLVVWSGTPWLSILRLADLGAKTAGAAVESCMARPLPLALNFQVRRFLRGRRGQGETVAELRYTIFRTKMRRVVKIAKTGFTIVEETTIR